MSKNRTLVVGWFSWPDSKATFGDVQAMEVVTKWLSDEGFEYDIVKSNPNGFDGPVWCPWINEFDPKDYDSFIFVCGPWFHSPRGQRLLEHFSSCFTIGIDISVCAESHGFSLLLARDYKDIKNPDIVFEARSDAVKVVGVALVHTQEEYGDSQRHSQVEETVKAYLESEGAAVIKLDTRTEDNNTGISTVSQLEALIRCCDVVISSRLHGMIYSLKNDTPVLAIDCIVGGAKVTAQAEALQWPAIINGDGITVDKIKAGVERAMIHKLYIDNVKADASVTITKTKETMIEELRKWKSQKNI
jgi:hypothetical protein